MLIKKILIILFIGCIPVKSFLQNQLILDSISIQKMNTKNLSKIQISNLAFLGKVWGFLKYHHPKVTSGYYNWDSELFRIMPKILDANNPSSRDKILLQWIQDLGDTILINPINCENEPNIKQKADYSWINSKAMNKGLVNKLLGIKKNNVNENYYAITNGSYTFTNEDPYYSIIGYPNAYFRLLSLFRFWNIIQYHYPYRYMITEEPWNDIIEKLIPKFIEAKNAEEYRLSILSMLQYVHDSHAILTSDPDRRKKPGIKIKFIDEKATVIYVSNNIRQLKVGDIIMEKNGEKIGNIVQRMVPITPASNKSAQFRDIAREILCSNDSFVKLKVQRNDSIFNIIEPTKLYSIYVEPSPNKVFKLISKDIGYIHIGTVASNQLKAIFEASKQTKGLILDLRNYPLDFDVLYNLSDYLLPHPIPFVQFSTMSFNCPGVSLMGYIGEVGRDRTDYYKGKIVILVDENTQSRAEFFAMAFQKAPNSIVIGSQTAGADGNIINISLVGGYNTAISGVGVYYPDGKETQRIGIVPNFEVKPTIEGIKKGKDEVLEKAIEYLNKN